MAAAPIAAYPLAMGMHISKWYLDVVDADGAGAICYAAAIRWRRVQLNYSATLEFDADGHVRERMTLRRYAPPERNGSSICFGNDRLRSSGTWTPARPLGASEGTPTTLLETDKGYVRWQLESARAEAEWTSPRGTLRGLGYVERLDMTLPPWDLPIDELHWGRFVGEGGDAAWIEWRGEHPLSLAWRNGEVSDGVNVEFHGSDTLREGPLVTTVFSKVPVLRRSLPLAMLNVHETKWRSRATLHPASTDNAADAAIPGWAIHEVVKWV